jgi:hypothetical protein
MKTFNEWLKDRVEITEGEIWDNWRPAAWLDGRVPLGWQKKIDQKYARELGGISGRTGNYDAQGNEILSPEQQWKQQAIDGAKAYRQQQQQPQATYDPHNQPQQYGQPQQYSNGFSDNTLRSGPQALEIQSKEFDKRIEELEYDHGREKNYGRKQKIWDEIQMLKRQKKAFQAAVASYVPPR